MSHEMLAKIAHRFAVLIVAAPMLASISGAQAAESTVTAKTDQPAGALAYASQIKTLYKSDGLALYQSHDGGKQWAEVPFTASANGGRIMDVAVSSTGDGALYVAGPGLGMLRSVDAGKSWTSVDQGLPSRAISAFATHSTLSETLYAVVDGQGIYRSENGGAQWRMVDKGPQAQIRRLIHSDLEGSMQTGWLFAATDKGVYRAMDCFCGWRNAGNIPVAVSAVVFDPKQPMTLYAAAGRQVFSTTNGGEEWQPAGSPGGEISALAHSPSGVIFALLADGRVVQSTDKGRQWQ